MSCDYVFQQSDILVTFPTKKDMEKRVKAFERAVKKHDELYEEGSLDYPLCAFVEKNEDEGFRANVFIDAGEDTYIDMDKLVELICKHFPTANGTISWADACTNAGGFVRGCSGGSLSIENGKILPNDSKVLQEMKKDMCELLDYIKRVIGDKVMDKRKCGIAHLYKKYKQEEDILK